MKRFERKEYLDFLLRWKDKEIIKVVSGVRRCGKSTLFEIYKDHLLENGVDAQQIISINFEDLEYEDLDNYRTLYDYIKQRLLPDKKNYIFLDEIQNVSGFEKAADSLFIKSNVDLYLTGSNAYFMSGELATLLSGRYVELNMLPLSFQEYCLAIEGKNTEPVSKKYLSYLQQSSFPYATKLNGQEQEIKEYLLGIYHSILLKDIVARLKVTDVMMLESVTKFMFNNIGNQLSVSKIVNTMVSGGRKIDNRTVEKYIKGLTDSLLVYEATRYQIKGKQHLSTLSKYYLVDIGLRYMLLGGRNADTGHILENVIYLELLRRGYSVYVGQTADGEVDFVAVNQGITTYFQVAASVRDEGTLKRELKSLQSINDHYQKIILTLDEDPIADYDGILRMNALDWLLHKTPY